MKNNVFFLFVFFLFGITNVLWGQGIVVNEVQSSNKATIKDESGNYEDWIELYNKGLAYVNLSGYGLSDDQSMLFKWIFPNVLLGPDQYLLIWASGKNRAVSGSHLHTNFKLNSSGGVIVLTDPSGVKIDEVSVKELVPDVSYGRLPNGIGDFVFFDKCTPNTVNFSNGYSEILKPPEFSKNSGFYSQGFDLSLSTSDPGVIILYTLDGSEPDSHTLDGTNTTYNYKNQYPENPGQLKGALYTKTYETLKYNVPITISDRSSLPNKIASISSTYHFDPYYIPEVPILKGTVVRARAMKPGALSSYVVTKNYFVSPKIKDRFSLPVISLSISEDELFDYYKGIYVAGVDFDNWRDANPTVKPGSKEGIGNYYRKKDEDERLANLSYFVNGEEILNQDIGIAIHGGGSRIHQSKSLGVYARSKYGDNTLNFKFFSDIDNVHFKRLILSNSGTDFPFTMFRDAFCQELCKSLYCETESYQPTVTFINGEYWGILNVREKYTDEYFSEIFNIDKDELDFITVPDHVQEGDNKDYHNLVDFFSNNSLADPSNYEIIKKRLDTESFADFFIANIFLLNSDWPKNNVQCWRKKTNGYIENAPYGHDGRWRWAFHDMDNTFTFGSDEKIDSNTLAAATALDDPAYSNPAWSTLFLRKLLENDEFKNYFINRFADLMNSTFLPSRMNSVLKSMRTTVESEMEKHIERWKLPKDIPTWDYYIKIEQDFSKERLGFQRDHIRKQFNISNDVKVILKVSNIDQGYIKMNTINIVPSTPGVSINPYPWTGIYFNKVPVKVKAVPFPGYIFSHWSGDSESTEPEITIIPTDDFALTANFEPTTTIDLPKIIYFWMMDENIKDNVPLTTISSTYSIGSNVGVINYQSCLAGYPFTSADFQNYRKSDMERKDSPTSLNYFSEVNDNKSYAASGMKGIQITQPFQNGELENNLVFSFSTVGYKDIKFDIAVLDEGAATGIIIEYSTNSGNPIWRQMGLAKTSFPIFSTYQLIETDFKNIPEANGNPDFKIRLRFTGTNMVLNDFKNITFNNVSVQGVPVSLSVHNDSISNFIVYPNPAKNILVISGHFDLIEYKIYSMEGKMVQKGKMETNELNVSQLPIGLYILKLKAGGNSGAVKFIKN